MEIIYRLYASFFFRKEAVKRRFNKKFYTWYTKKIVASYGENLKVNFSSQFTSKTILGNNNNFNGIVISGAGQVKIGDNFHSGTNCKLITSFHNYEGTRIPYDSSYITKDILIGDNVWIGDDVIILAGVTLGEGVIVQAGSVVVSDIPACSIAGGHPAKVFKSRDVDRYNYLKKEKKFH